MQHLKEDIQKKEFHNTYLLYGEEEYLVHFYRDKLKETILDGADEMNYSYFQGGSIDLLEVKEIAQTLPFFQEHRLIVMEDSKLCKNANDFADVIESVPDSTIFVFVEKEVNKRTKLYKYIQKNGIAVELNAMSDQETLQFVAVHLGKAGKKILYLLTRHFNILLQIKSCKQSGKGELAKKIGIPPFSVGKYQMQAKHFTQKNRST